MSLFPLLNRIVLLLPASKDIFELVQSLNAKYQQQNLYSTSHILNMGFSLSSPTKQCSVASTSFFFPQRGNFQGLSAPGPLFQQQMKHYTGKVNIYVPRYIVDARPNFQSAFLGWIQSDKTHRVLEDLCNSSSKKLGITTHCCNLLPFSDCSMMILEGQEHRFSNFTPTPLGGPSSYNVIRAHISLLHTPYQCSGSPSDFIFFLWQKHKHALKCIVKQGQVLSIIHYKGLSIFLVKFSLVPSCPNLSADCFQASTYKKFRIKRAWFNALCGDRGYNSPLFIF